MAGKLFTDRTVEQHTDSLASFMPGGRPFLAKKIPQSTLRGLLLGLGQELLRVSDTINDITYEHEISQTTLLIEEWESALGIPDECFVVADDIETRRQNVLIKLASLGVQTEQDFVDLAALFGYTVDIIPGADRGLFDFVLGYPLYLFDYPASARFTQFVRIFTTEFPNAFTYTFPIVFGPAELGIVECLFNKLSPSNVEVKFEYLLPDEDAIITESAILYIGTEDGGIILLESA